MVQLQYRLSSRARVRSFILQFEDHVRIHCCWDLWTMNDQRHCGRVRIRLLGWVGRARYIADILWGKRSACDRTSPFDCCVCCSIIAGVVDDPVPLATRVASRELVKVGSDDWELDRKGPTADDAEAGTRTRWMSNAQLTASLITSITSECACCWTCRRAVVCSTTKRVHRTKIQRRRKRSRRWERVQDHPRARVHQ